MSLLQELTETLSRLSNDIRLDVRKYLFSGGTVMHGDRLPRGVMPLEGFKKHVDVVLWCSGQYGGEWMVGLDERIGLFQPL